MAGSQVSLLQGVFARVEESLEREREREYFTRDAIIHGSFSTIFVYICIIEEEREREREREEKYLVRQLQLKVMCGICIYIYT